MKRPPEWPVLDRYLAGESSPEEAEVVRQWLAEDSRHMEILEALRTAGRSQRRWDVGAAWNRVQAARSGTETSVPAEHPRIAARRQAHTERERSAHGMLRVAASVLLMVASVWILWTTLGTGSMQEIATARGERATVHLPDGTVVDLGGDSRLSYPRRFRSGVREVRLEGEAYFQVAHRMDQPFLVSTRDAVAQVLGTEFGVRAYRDDEEVRVIVVSGRVRVRADELAGDTGVVLGAGDLARVAGARRPEVDRGVEVDRHVSWKMGYLAFDDVPAREALTQLERWFDLEFDADDRVLAGQRVSAFFRTDDVAEVLASLSMSLDARYERHGRRVVLLPN
jgi:transmembrane sensor